MHTSLVRLHTRPVCYLALFRCMLAVILVTHKSLMTIPTPTMRTPTWYATIPDLLCVLHVPVLLKWDDDVSTIPPNPVRQSIWFVFSLLCFREAAFSNYQIAHGLPPPLSNSDFLECWYLSNETVLSDSAYWDQTWEISEHYSVVEDASAYGCISPRMRASPSTCRVLTSVGT